MSTGSLLEDSYGLPANTSIEPPMLGHTEMCVSGGVEIDVCK